MHHHYTHRFSLQHFGRAGRLKLLQLVSLQVAADPIVVTLDKAEDARVGILDAAEFDLIDKFRPPTFEMPREPLGDKTDRRIELGQFISTTAGVVFREPNFALIAVDLILLDQLFIDDVDFGNR